MPQSLTQSGTNSATHETSRKGFEATGINSDHAAISSPALQVIAELQEKYNAERTKRLRPDGLEQYVFLDRTADPHLHALSDDPWLDDRLDTVTLHDGQVIKHLVLGAGIGGLLAGIHFVKAGVAPEDIFIIDQAGGWGGAWYYNRYPGVTCDIESYVYLPLLQETGYMPRHRYSYGHEIRTYLETLASRYGLDRNAMFRTKISNADWDDTSKEWVVAMTKHIRDDPPVNFKVRTRFFSHFAGIHVHQKLPAIPAIHSYTGQQFHIARWDYSVTGGSQENPTLDKLRNKRVAIVGTGASGIQGTVALAKYAQELYVFQRTPAQVDTLDQRPTDMAEWKSITKDPNWWDIRNSNLANSLAGLLGPDEPSLVDDEVSRLTTYRPVFGGKDVNLTPADLPQYMKSLHEEDLPRMTRIRERVAATVHDPTTAAKLTPWYPSWCKRPLFHDHYLTCFNQPNVHLVDTDGKGVSAVTTNGLRGPDGHEYPVDVIVWATGYRGPLVGWTEERSGMIIRGRDGQRFDDKWNDNVASLHGVMTSGFPNLFLMGVFQSGLTLAWTWVAETMTQHAAYIAVEAERRARAQAQAEALDIGNGESRPGPQVMNGFSVEPSKDAEEAWSVEVFKRATGGAAMGGCTPNYFNDEGVIDRWPMEKKLKKARGGPWGGGMEDYRRIIREWREQGEMQGLRVDVVAA